MLGRHAKQLDGRVQRRDVDKTPHSQLVAAECLAVCVDGRIVIGACREEPKMCRR